MDKKNIQDVVPPTQRKSIRNIPIPNRSNKNGEIKRNTPPIHKKEEFDFEERNTRPRKNNIKKYFILIGSVVTLILLFVVFSSFTSATIKIKPKIESSTFDERMVIEDLSTRENNESLGYRIIELAKESEKIVEAQNEELVQEKASGEITIFNEYSESNQTLITNTRFESEDGKIYRIQESISVPGYTESNGEIIPGQITATVYADEEGEEYNLESGDFTIPGFKGQEPYDFFYAKTETSISGGFDGVRRIVSDEDIELATTELQEDVRNKLLQELNEQITEEFYIHQDGDSFSFDNIEQEQIENSENVKLKLRGKISAKIFNKVDISNKIADNIFANYFSNENTLIENFENIEFSISENDLSEMLNASGNSNFIWQVDENKLKEDLIGIEKNLLSTVMQDYTEIQTAEAVIKPFWVSSFPQEKKKIKVEIVR
ncbi:hypothetical protein GW764_00350 [Candidatus Parcubacteria bacterium]|nr:hypothetical protein [Candidatus Parcubacteria bacterium]